uniref:uncharacterized protein n=1 Tax=Pristiophorus japonicus TaxID=55135 RepID=UPI00398F3C1C
MKCFILEVSLLLALIYSGNVQAGDDLEIVLSNGSSPVLLPCSTRSTTPITDIQWLFTRALGNSGVGLCVIDNDNPQCNSSQFPHITLAESEGFRTGNYSLLFTATMENAGNYDCLMYDGQQLSQIESHNTVRISLIVINVSVIPDGPILLGSSVYLTCEVSDPYILSSMHGSNPITGKWVEIQWKLNKELIYKNKQRKFDFRTLNISNFQLSDAGRYTYTIRFKNGKSCHYSHLLEQSEATMTSPITEHSSTGTSAENAVPVQNNEDNYATITMDALGKSGKAAKPSAEASIYAEVKPN